MAFMVAHLVCRGLARARTLGAPRYKRKPPKSSLLVNVAYLLSFVPHVADASGAIPPPSNTTVGGGAFVNFSAATAAASFTGADNRLTFIGCAGFHDQRQSDRACVPLLGHTRGQCYAFPVYGNATSVPVCRCIAYAGLTPPGNCVDATCVWGADACSVRQWQNYVVIFLDTFALLLTAYVFGFGLYVTIVGRKNLKMNSMTVTLLSMTLASLFHLLWRVCAFLGYAVLLSAVPIAEVQQPITIPGFVLCSVIGIVAFPLQWLELAKKTTRIKTTRGGSSKVPHIAVAVTAFVISAVTIFFVFTGQLFLVSGASREFISVSWLCMHSMGFREGAWTRQA